MAPRPFTEEVLSRTLSKDSYIFGGLSLNQRKVGGAWEQVAAAYLSERGAQILECNFRCRQGEIDIVARHQEYLVFVEVKFRKTTSKGTACAAVTPVKMQKICRVADYYRYLHQIGDTTPIRYDVIAIDDGEIRWFQNAFFHTY